MKEMWLTMRNGFPIEEMRQLPDDYRNWYCPKCYPEVLEAYWKLLWNREKH